MAHESSPAPLTSAERIDSLDLLRGFALLGILLMNIQVFAMPGPAYTNPSNYGDLGGVNLWVWVLTHILADQKFMSLFSMLFGAGVCVFTERAMEKTGHAAALHYRRTFWLLVFGLIHAHLIWYGDILYSYALCGLLLYLFRRLSPRALLIWSAVFLLVPAVYSGFIQWAMPYIPAEAKAGMMQSWAPPAEKIQAEVSGYQGSWIEQQSQRHQSALMLETVVFAIHFFWRAMGMMLLGMALYKLGVLSGRRPPAFYTRMLLIGAILGISLSAWGVHWNFSHGWSLEASMFGGSLFNYFGSIALALAYVGLVIRLYQAQAAVGLQQRLRAVGRMAFSNYIAQSLLCTFVFYGFGLGLFGQVERWQQLLVVLAVWTLQLIWSPIWMRHFLFGPLEWLWRALSYMQRPRMRRV
ncbi:DUF418 domain-containing protein [Pseudomarimonas salicorniae]|uniref:DUF418 domain-containing protein n=1 Tax=Pseudomarimonas salicorniae TaxID=2933270 RepID=A0ABT0GBX8_9GAMM|nr:DUF418 domain-containing protein [Lysobacter sp. CAU 1642]MCK7592057.1 DUF418 domain-containing protein [Lysobacter sp. CAU 1642]